MDDVFVIVLFTSLLGMYGGETQLLLKMEEIHINAMALIFTLISGLQTLFFGMWFDMEYNKNLKS